MSRFTKAVDIWATPVEQLQPGQWVFAGTDEGAGSPTRGRFLGVKPSGSIVVAWMGNARSHRRSPEGIKGYLASLRNYAKGH
jgi:hypothetical protein